MYEVVLSARARAQTESLPEDGKRALDEAVEVLGGDPWSGEHYQHGHSDEWRSLAFGTWGVVVYLIHESRRAVLLLDVTWAG